MPFFKYRIMKQIPSQQEIQRFLAVNQNNKDYNSGYGFGYGNGEGASHGFEDGSGYGQGAGEGASIGFGYGRGEGAGSGHNNGNGNGFDNSADYNKDITFINGYPIHIVDYLFTIIYQIHGNYAKGAILNEDLTPTPCFIARVDNCFAHGETLHDAVRDAQAKALNHAPVETRIQRFVQKYPDPDKPVPFTELFDWHNILTGSCRLGRNHFVEQHQLDTNAEYSPRFFIELTKNDFGGEIIEQLAKAYNL